MLNWRHAIRAVGFGIAAYIGSGAIEGHAADMPLFGGNDPTPQTKVEFGTGWYIRGDGAWSFDKGPALLSDLSYGADEIRNNWSADLGAGYKFNNWFRSDLTLGVWGPQRVSSTSQVNCYQSINNVTSQTTGDSIGVYAVPNTCNQNQQADLKKYAMLLNGYVDLGTWYGVTPFLGAGIGAALIEQEASANYTNASDGSPYNATLTLPTGSNPTFLQGPALTTALNPQPVIHYGTQNWNYSNRTIKYNFAWALMAGFAYNLTENAALELGYRYVNFGQITGYNGMTGTTFTKNLSAQEIRVGLRYLVD
jgi:opacity protein-like surface antigen